MPALLPEFVSPEVVTAFFGVVMIDLTLAGDNAVVIGLAAAGLPAHQRKKAIMIGILAATLMRIGFASVAVQLLAIVGLLLAGGLLLLWVAWKMWQELRTPDPDPQAEFGETSLETHSKSLRQAVIQIIVADVSMSLDNVLAVAGAAREHPVVLVFGLALSIVLMGAAATFIARLLQRHHWIAWVGLVIILFVALRMIWHGGHEVLAAAAH
ncbi:MAG: TerC family protein [Paracoccaceae bacterium]|nr:TerC family protein [Paracoccaceae bacterium]